MSLRLLCTSHERSWIPAEEKQNATRLALSIQRCLYPIPQSSEQGWPICYCLIEG